MCNSIFNRPTLANVCNSLYKGLCIFWGIYFCKLHQALGRLISCICSVQRVPLLVSLPPSFFWQDAGCYDLQTKVLGDSLILSDLNL